MARAGVVGQAELETPSTPTAPARWTPSTWAWIWFGMACLVIVGFHIRVFGVTVPPVPEL